MKLLGFQFSNRPYVHAQVDYLINRAASRSFVIRRLSGVGVNKERLKNIYCSIVRSVLEYSSVRYGPMLAQYEKNRLENVQKNCLRSIFGFEKSYEELLSESCLESLEVRRKKRLENLQKKTSKNKQFEHWFPTNDNQSSQRSGNKYREIFARSDRLYDSPLFEMRRLLNNTENETRTSNLSEFIDLSDLFNVP